MSISARDHAIATDIYKDFASIYNARVHRHADDPPGVMFCALSMALVWVMENTLDHEGVHKAIDAFAAGSHHIADQKREPK